MVMMIIMTLLSFICVKKCAKVKGLPDAMNLQQKKQLVADL